MDHRLINRIGLVFYLASGTAMLTFWPSLAMDLGGKILQWLEIVVWPLHVEQSSPSYDFYRLFASILTFSFWCVALPWILLQWKYRENFRDYRKLSNEKMTFRSALIRAVWVNGLITLCCVGGVVYWIATHEASLMKPNLSANLVYLYSCYIVWNALFGMLTFFPFLKK